MRDFQSIFFLQRFSNVDISVNIGNIVYYYHNDPQ